MVSLSPPLSARTPAAPGAGGPSVVVLADMADALIWPLLVLDREGCVLHANEAARRLIRQGQQLVLLSDRRLQLRPARWQSALEAAQAQLDAAPQQPVWFPCGNASMATLSPLGTDPAAARLLALTAPGGSLHPVRAYARLHGLTAAETRVLEHLARGATVTEAAEALGVAPSTVRSQVLSLRRKCQHDSIWTLLREIARLPPMATPTAEGE